MKKMFMKLFPEYIDVFLFVIVICVKLANFSRQFDPSTFRDKVFIFPALASALLLVAFSMLYKRSRSRSRFLFFCNLIITFVLICDQTYFSYFKDMISVLVLVNGIMLGAVNDSVTNVFSMHSLWYGIDLVILYPLMMIIKRHARVSRLAQQPSNLRNIERRKAPRSLKNRLAAFACIALISCTINGVKLYQVHIAQPRVISTMFNRVYVVNALGALDYHYLDMYSTLSSALTRLIPISAEKETQIESYMQSNASKTTNYTGKYKGKNLIVIQVEALQQFPIGKTYNGQEITPNLNKWIKRSMYFDNYYYQTAAGGTSDAEFVSNNSLYPAQAGAAYFLYAGNKFDSLSNELNDNGYYTAALHAYKETFWNRNVMYKSLGFDDYFNENDYEFTYSVGLGLNDHSFFLQSIDKMKAMKTPYESFVITLSSHYPYDDVFKYGDFDPGEYKGILLGRYLQAIHYADEQLGMLLDELDKQGISDNAVIALYGDHYAIPKDASDQLYKFLGISNPSEVDYMQLQKVPLIIHVPDESIKGVNSTLAGQIDFYPTIANLMGIQAKNVMGRDLLNSSPDKIIFRNGSFISNDVYFMSQNDTYYDLKTEQPLQQTQELLDQKADVLNKLNYSDTILKHNLLKQLN